MFKNNIKVQVQEHREKQSMHRHFTPAMNAEQDSLDWLLLILKFKNKEKDNQHTDSLLLSQAQKPSN